MTIEVALGLCASRGSRTIDVGAGAADGVLVTADGLQGHSTGWLGARLAIRAVIGSVTRHGRFVGAGDDFPDEWGWAGAMQSRAAAKRVYEGCAADLGARGAALDEMFVEIDRVVRNISAHVSIHGMLVGCIAAAFEGRMVRGAHVGVGRALLLREGATRVQSLVTEHYLHLVAKRMRVELPADDACAMPREVVANGLGVLDYAGVGVDRFEVELAPRDLLVVCSRRLDISDSELVALARGAASLDDLARSIEQRASRAYSPPEQWRATDVAFALARPR